MILFHFEMNHEKKNKGKMTRRMRMAKEEAREDEEGKKKKKKRGRRRKKIIMMVCKITPLYNK